MNTTTIPAELPEIEKLIDAKIRDYVQSEFGGGDMVVESMIRLSRTILRSFIPVSTFKLGDEVVADMVMAKLIEIDETMDEEDLIGEEV